MLETKGSKGMPSVEVPVANSIVETDVSLPARPGLLRRIWGRLSTQRVVESDNWQVGLCSGDAGELIDAGLPALRWVAAPSGHYFADPFLVEASGRTFLLVEDWDRARRKGSISAAELVGGVPGAFKTVLEEDHHLSYPFVLKTSDGVFMIPEQGQSGAVHLYEAVDFPWRWRRGPRLIEGAFFDPTVCAREDGYWLWLSRGGALCSDELHLFHSPRLDGPFEPHPLNPVSQLSRRCRPAGPALWHGGTLYRPAQNSEGGYGRGLLLYSVDEMTPTQYRESLVRSLSPWPDRDGLHHVSSAGGWLALDANRYRRERVPVTEVLAAKLRSMRHRR
jgi:hypothetical protein